MILESIIPITSVSHYHLAQREDIPVQCGEMPTEDPIQQIRWTPEPNSSNQSITQSIKLL